VSRGNLLLELQTADDHVAALQRHVQALEAELAGDPALDALHSSLTAAHDGTVHAQAAVRGAELELGEVKAKADALHRQLYGGSVRNPSALMTLQHELDGMSARLSPLEDTVLERMDEAEACAADEHRISAEVAAFEERRAGAAGPDTARLAELRGALEVAQREREAIVATVPPADLALYERLARRVHPVVVHVSNSSCGGCRMPLGIQEARSARAGETIVQCSTCDRVLVS
jgi:predicted  nucleic acid-binding Zn-ribbon protein